MKTSAKNTVRLTVFLAEAGAVSAVLLIACASRALGADFTEPWPGAHTAPAFAGGELRDAYCDMQSLIEGSWGGLVAAAAAVMAVAAAAFGNLRHTTSLIVTAIGAFTISTGVSVYFGDMCSSNGGTNKTMLTAERAEPAKGATQFVTGFETSAPSAATGKSDAADPFQSL